MRARLTPAERDAKRRERARFSFSDAAYRHYNPEKDGFGNADQWEDIARQLFGLLGKVDSGPTPNKWLRALYIDEMPTTLAALKSAFRAAMFKSHPDYGGSNETARATMEAFAVLKTKF